MSALPIVDERLNQMLRALRSDSNAATVEDILSGEVFDMVSAYTRYKLFWGRLQQSKDVLNVEVEVSELSVKVELLPETIFQDHVFVNNFNVKFGNENSKASILAVAETYNQLPL